MPEAQKAINDILRQILDEYGGRISIDGGSKVLVSDPDVAIGVAEATEPVRTPYGPALTVVAREPGNAVDVSAVPGVVSVQAVNDLKMDHFTHAVFGVQSEDPKFVLQGLKHMIYAMQPKGVAIVISLKQESGKAEGPEGSFNVGLEDKIKYQSKGKVDSLAQVMEYAGFERGKIRSFERSTEAGGDKVDAECILAMKWDQLTA